MIPFQFKAKAYYLSFIQDERRGHVSYFSVTVTVIVTVIIMSAMFNFLFCPKLQDKHRIKHYDYDHDYDHDYDKRIRYKFDLLYQTTLNLRKK